MFHFQSHRGKGGGEEVIKVEGDGTCHLGCLVLGWAAAWQRNMVALSLLGSSTLDADIYPTRKDLSDKEIYSLFNDLNINSYLLKI